MAVPLKVIGPYYPRGDNAVAPLGYVSDQWNALKVDNAYVTAQTNLLAAASPTGTLADVSHVDTVDATKALKTAVDSADAAYLARSTIGVGGGLVPLDVNTQIPSAYVPSGLPTARTVFAAPDPTWLLSTSQVVFASTPNIKEYTAATISIADPGYPYIPWINGQVCGFASGPVSGGVAGTLADPGNGIGCGVWAQAAVYDSAGNLWARAVTGSNFRSTCFPLQPFAVFGQAPMTLTGATTLTLYLGIFSRVDSGTNSFTFTRAGSLFSALVMGGL